METLLLPATDTGWVRLSRKELWVCVILKVSRDPKAISISTTLCIFVGKKKKETAPVAMP